MALLSRARVDRVDDVFDGFAQVDGLTREDRLAGLDLRELQQISDQTRQALGISMHGFDEFVGAHAVVEGAVEQCLGVGEDDRAGCAQLVRDVGHEVFPQRLEPSHVGDVVHDEHDAGAGPRRHGRAHQHPQRSFGADDDFDFGGSADAVEGVVDESFEGGHSESLAEHRFVAEAEQGLAGAVAQDDLAVVVEGDDAFAHGLQESVEAVAFVGERVQVLLELAGQAVEGAGEVVDVV